MTSGRMDRRLFWLLILSVLTLAGAALVTIIAVPKILNTDSSTDAIRHGNDLTSCRAQFSAAVTEAQTVLFVDKSRLDVLTNQGLRAAIQHDDAALQQVIEQSPQLEQAVVDDGVMVQQRTQEYRAAVQQAKDDPDGFVRQCNGG